MEGLPLRREPLLRNPESPSAFPIRHPPGPDDVEDIRRESLRVQQLLGHRDIKTTARYSHLTPGFMQETVIKGNLFSSVDSQAERATGSKTGSAGSTGTRGFGEPIDFMVRPAGIEPATLSLEG